MEALSLYINLVTMQRVIYFLVVLTVSGGCFNSPKKYYWREYFGVVPKDALQGGTDADGNPTYIGQVHLVSGLQLGTIHRGVKKVRPTVKTAIYVENFVKILRSQKPDWYQWVSINIDKLHLLTNCQLVAGGYQDGLILNIVRVNHEGATVIGKILPPKNTYKGLTK